jgi:hypothetical protein
VPVRSGGTGAQSVHEQVEQSTGLLALVCAITERSASAMPRMVVTKSA